MWMAVCELIIAAIGSGNLSGSARVTGGKAQVAFVCIYVAGFASTWGPAGECTSKKATFRHSTRSTLTFLTFFALSTFPLPPFSLGRLWRNLPSQHQSQISISLCRLQLASELGNWLRHSLSGRCHWNQRLLHLVRLSIRSHDFRLLLHLRDFQLVSRGGR
jgi:hypothetical protein